MEFFRKSIPDIILIKLKVFKNHINYFTETFRQDKFEDVIGHQVNFCQHNETKSNKDSNLPTLEMLKNECLLFNYNKNLYNH
jgi:dTDP-4-dehydrorhamnose 3,5-epimerase-like enzyme